MKDIASIYLHFPFCETKCHYCDFYSIGNERTQASDPTRFEKALFKEAKISSSALAPSLETIFMGGGTPSMTPPESMRRALSPILEGRKFSTDFEWTMEANPSSVHRQKLEEYQELGVNRISLGVQALQDAHLKTLGRVHNRHQAFRALDAIFSSGMTNVSVDLICGVPGFTQRELESSLKELTHRFPITHLSCYLLTLPKTHRMYRELPDEETQLQQLLLIDRFLKNEGFRHYEISNFARPGKEARHNLRYWNRLSYLGLGPSAHSFDQKNEKRWKNFSSLHRYSESLQRELLPVEWEESLKSDDIHLEKWMLGLRLDTGFPKKWLQTPLQKTKAKQMEAQRLLEEHPDHSTHFRLTAQGFAVSDQIAAEIS